MHVLAHTRLGSVRLCLPSGLHVNLGQPSVSLELGNQFNPNCCSARLVQSIGSNSYLLFYLRALRMRMRSEVKLSQVTSRRVEPSLVRVRVRVLV